MVGDFDVFVTINFEKVSTAGIDDETADPECVIVFNVE
jgi:hypothetical protein